MTVQQDPIQDALATLPAPPMEDTFAQDVQRAARLELARSAPPPPPKGVLGWAYATGIPLVLLGAGSVHLVMSIMTMVRVWG